MYKEEAAQENFDETFLVLTPLPFAEDRLHQAQFVVDFVVPTGLFFLFAYCLPVSWNLCAEEHVLPVILGALVQHTHQLLH